MSHLAGSVMRSFRRLDGGGATHVDETVELEITLEGGGVDHISIGAGDGVRVRRSRP